MKGVGSDLFSLATRRRSVWMLIVLGLLYLLLMGFEVPLVLKNGVALVSEVYFSDNSYGFFNANSFILASEENLEEQRAPLRPIDVPYQSRTGRIINEVSKASLSGLNFSHVMLNLSLENGILKSAREAVELGRKNWLELESVEENTSLNSSSYSKFEQCRQSISIIDDKFWKDRRVMVLPCGLTLGSYITVVAKPSSAHAKTETKISFLKEGRQVMVSEFMMELQGLKTVEGEDPPRIFHFNSRLKGDWSGKPVIEMNNCYRMQWGTPQRCEGWKTQVDEESVDGLEKCAMRMRDDDNGAEESKALRWLNRLIRRAKMLLIDLPFPFTEEKPFVLTLSAGLEGYHVNVDGRHVVSFPYRTGFTLGDATGFSIYGNIDVRYVFAASLPMSHPSFALQRHLDLSDRYKAPPLPDGPVELFIGILSASNHFSERMALRKSWMQHDRIKSSNVIVRFFVALHARKEVNVEVKKEAKFFGDIVIVPYMDNYDLVVLKTISICDYGVRIASAKYIMKCDDDTFVRVDAIIKEAENVPENKSLYIGNINYYHKPMRSGKWAVTYEEWPEKDYPPYANGPGYIISSDIASSILSDFEKQKLRLFKMEDVSMGMWVEKVSKSRPVKYVHSLKFCQFGCIEDYITAHYQSPRQMICLWNKLIDQGRPLCCSMR